jgi:phage N-6-adenine-methyltransferase
MSDLDVRTGPTMKRGRSKQDYGTPWDFINAVQARFGALDVDLAASEENAKARTWVGETVGSLVVHWAKTWPSGNMWLNPPYADISPWAEKCAAESRLRTGLILFLTPASVGSEWFAAHVYGKAMVFGLRPRLTFDGTDAPYPKDLILSVFGMGMNGFDTWRWDARPAVSTPKEEP